jgi:outer membrane protein TolC
VKLKLMVAGALALMCVGAGYAQSPMVGGGAAALTVDQAVAEANAANPEIRAAVRRLSLAQLKITTARSLDDPMLMVRDWGTPLRQPWDLNQAQLMFMLQQTFPGRQKRDVRATVANDDAEVAAEDLEMVRQDVAAEVRKTCAELLRVADAFAVHDREAALLKEAVASAMTQYTTDKVSQTDVLRAQMAVTRLNEHMIELEEDCDNARAQLNALLGRRPEEAIDIAGTYTDAGALPSIEDLEHVAVEHRPELVSLRKQIATAQDQGKMTRLAMKPDFTAGLGYMLMPTGSNQRNAYMAELSMNLPWLIRARHEGESKQADAATAVTQAELEARANTVFLEVREAQVAVAAAQRRVKLYRDTLLPQANATFKAATAEYQNNRAGFANMIDSQNMLLEIETAQFNASAAMDAGIAKLERAMGAPLTELHTQTPGGMSK